MKLAAQLRERGWTVEPPRDDVQRKIEEGDAAA
jgi:hypothetical protein